MIFKTYKNLSKLCRNQFKNMVSKLLTFLWNAKINLWAKPKKTGMKTS